jgi:predicted nucleic acid-binding protein
MGTQTREIADSLVDYELVGLDTMCFIYHFEANPKYIPFTNTLFEMIENEALKAITSTLTLAEILVKPIKQGNLVARDDYKYTLINFPNLILCEISADIAEEAAHLKARYGIRLPDALQLATSIYQRAQAFITNDQSLKKVRETEVLIIDDFVVNET